jgi:hypothetical protein
MATNFNDINLFGDKSLSDLFKQIHKNNKDTDKQINELIDAIKPLATSNAGSAVMLMPTVKDLIDVNVKNNDQLIKMAGIAQRASTSNINNGGSDFFNLDEIQVLLDEQNQIKEEGQKLLDKTGEIQKQIG